MATARLQIPIDKAGRVVLPKEIRDRLGILEGAEFEVIEEGNRIILSPVEKEPKVVKRGGILVVVPERAASAEEQKAVIGRLREERNKKFR